MTFIKKSAAVSATKLFKSLSYDSSQGIKHFYMQLLCAAEQMIMQPDQATFNKCFINALPSHIRDELVMQDQIAVDYTSCDQLWTAILRVDHALDSLKAVQAYCSLGLPRPTVPQSGHANNTLSSSKMSMFRLNKLSGARYATLVSQKVGYKADPRKPTSNVGNPVRIGDGKGTPYPLYKQASGSSYKTNQYQKHPLQDAKVNPLCFKCGKIGWARECPNHDQKTTKVFTIGMGDDPSPVSLNEEIEEPLGEAPENDADTDDKAEECLVEDPYDPQNLSLFESEHEGEDNTEDRSFSFNPLSFMSMDEDNYVLKPASTRKQEELLSEEQIVAELVDDPVHHLKTDGELPTKKGAVPSAGKAPDKLTKKSPPMFDAKLRLLDEASKYPSDCSVELRWMLVSTIETNGTKALVIFDSGAETDALSPDFVRACHIPLLELLSPLVLQMGTKGSQSCIYYGTNVDLKVVGQQTKHYFDVVNIDRYDAILGAPWLNTHGVVLNFKNHVVTVGGGISPYF